MFLLESDVTSENLKHQTAQCFSRVWTDVGTPSHKICEINKQQDDAEGAERKPVCGDE